MDNRAENAPKRPPGTALGWLVFVLFLAGCGALGWFAAAAERGQLTGPFAYLAIFGALALAVAWWIEIIVKARRRMGRKNENQM